MKGHASIGRFAVRAPILPFATLARCTTVEALRALVEDPAIREAVFVASPDLSDGLDALEPAAMRALVRYVSRMAGRATPFGLFAGVAIGTIGTATHLELAPHRDHGRHTRLDMHYVARLCSELARDPAIRARLRYRTNTGLYLSAGRWRYAEATYAADRARTYHLAAVDRSPYVDAVIETARGGATIDELVAVLLADPEISRDEAIAFVDEVIESQLVVPELEPPLTGDEAGESLVRMLAAAGAQREAELLAGVQRDIAAIDREPLGTARAAYAAIAGSLAALPVPVQLPRLFQVDLHLAAPRLELSASVVDEIQRGGELLCQIGDDAAHDAFASFRTAFVARYETREVPLAEVLDDESGIGFGDSGHAAAMAPLLAELPFPAQPATVQAPVTPRSKRLLELVLRGGHEVVLDDADVAALSRREPLRTSDTVVVACELAAPSTAAIDAGDYAIYVHAVSAGTATRLLGRFCHGSAEVSALVRDIAERERALQPNAVLAEIVHLPEGRLGNLLLRPVIREHEIWYLATGGGTQIPLDDLVVSVRGDRVVLRSRSLDREVRPLLSSPHNHRAWSLPIYHFLGQLATQHGHGGVMWEWGGVLDAVAFLPRVRYGRFVLARARWLLDKRELAALGVGDKHAAVQALRTARTLPRWVVVTDGDNELPVDLDNELAIASFVQLVKARHEVVLTELFPGPDELCTTSPAGAHVHELVVPFARVAAEPAVAVPALPSSAPRRFPPGSQWLYAKLYGGAASLEIVLRDVVRPLVAEVRGAIDRWFFIRYADPDQHVRVRFHGDVWRQLSASTQRAIDAGLVWRVQLDTYEREVERYGGDRAIELCESIFAADSDAALAIIDANRGDAGADAKWQLALYGIDRLLDDLGCTLADKLALMTSARDAFAAEHRVDVPLTRALGDRFRKTRRDIAALLGGPGVEAFALRSSQIAPLAPELRRVTRAPFEQVALSLVHMHVNRLLAAAQRRQELVLYDLLRRHYESAIARAR